MNNADVLAVRVLEEEKRGIMYLCSDNPSKEDKIILKWLSKRIQGIENSYLDL